MVDGRGRRGVRGRALALVAAFVAAFGLSVIALADAPDDPGFPMQWALSGAAASSHAPQAWCANTGGVLVADVDSGADFGHADLKGKLVPGANFTSGRGDKNSPDGTGQAAVQDDHWHGTMTTGIMVADTNNGIGVAGVAPSARALIVKVLVPDKSATSTGGATGYGNDVAAGIEYAADYPGVKVINLSIGSDVPKILGISLTSSPIPGAIDYATSRGVLVVAAAGNNYGTQSEYTSVENEALVVGALTRDGSPASYSSTGSNIDAPGGDGSATVQGSILSTYLGNQYAAGDGTSFAAPQVAGTAAMLMARGMSAASARQTLLNTRVNGTRLNAAAALGRADNGPACPPGTTGPPPSSGGGITVKTPPKTAARTRTPAPPAAAAAPAPTPSAAPSPSPSPSASPSPTGPVAETFPSPRVLAHDPPPKAPGQNVPVPVLAAGLVGGIAAGYGALRLIQLLR